MCASEQRTRAARNNSAAVRIIGCRHKYIQEQRAGSFMWHCSLIRLSSPTPTTLIAREAINSFNIYAFAYCVRALDAFYLVLPTSGKRIMCRFHRSKVGNNNLHSHIYTHIVHFKIALRLCDVLRASFDLWCLPRLTVFWYIAARIICPFLHFVSARQHAECYSWWPGCTS